MSSKTRKPPTPKQLRYLAWLARRAGLEGEALLAYASRFLSEETGREVAVESLSDLPREAAGALIGHLVALNAETEDER